MTVETEPAEAVGRWRTLLAAAVGLSLALGLAWTYRENAFAGRNDFLAFYVGGRLAGTPDLYNPLRVRQVQFESAGFTHKALMFVRFPWMALLFYPLSRLPYLAAYAVWVAVLVTAFAIFIRLWPYPSALTYSLLSLPLFVSLMQGQDVALVLLWMAIAVRLLLSGRGFWAGLVFTLCGAKAHFFILLPLLIIRRRMWRFAAGLATGGSILIGLSFLVAGPEWPWQWRHLLATQPIHPRVEYMPNLTGLITNYPAVARIKWILVAAIVAAAWVAIRRTDFQVSLGAVLVGGLLIAGHAYMLDCAVLLPPLLALRAEAAVPWLRGVALLLLLPAVHALSLALPPGAVIMPLVLLLALCSMAWAALDRSGNSETANVRGPSIRPACVP